LFELIYATEGEWPWWSPWAELGAAEPRLPVPPSSFRRTWRLPPGVVPLGTAARRLPDPLAPADREPWWAGVRRAWGVGRAWLAAVGPEFGPDPWVAGQRRQLAEAELALRREHAARAPWSLGRALERLATAHRKQGPLVIDTAALREAGVGPSATFTPAPPADDGGPSLFDRLGLAYLPCRPAPVLTTRAQLEAWQAATGESRPDSEGLEQAVAEAAGHGRDA